MFIQNALGSQSRSGLNDLPAIPAIIQIDGVKWESPLPTNSGEAQSFNEDAERICERVNAK